MKYIGAFIIPVLLPFFLLFIDRFRLYDADAAYMAQVQHHINSEDGHELYQWGEETLLNEGYAACYSGRINCEPVVSNARVKQIEMSIK